MKLPPLQLQPILMQAKAKAEALWAQRSRFAPKPLPTLAVHPDGRYDEVNERVNVVLSPAYYWYKSSPVPLKSSRAAMRVAPSIFFSWIPEGNYRYAAFKEPNGYGFIACDPQATTARLAAQGLNTALIERIYFAQSALEGVTQPQQIGAQHALVSVKGVWVVLPARYAPGAQPYDTAPRTLPGPSLKVGRVRESGMSRKHFAVAAVLLALLIAAQGIEWRQAKVNIQKLEAERQAALEKARLPQTMLQLESIERRLSTAAAQQASLREQLSALLALNTGASRMERILVSTTGIEAEYMAGTDEQEAALAALLRNRFPEAKVASSNGRLTVAIAW